MGPQDAVAAGERAGRAVPAGTAASASPSRGTSRGQQRVLVARLVLVVFAFVLALALGRGGRTPTQVLGPWIVLVFGFVSMVVFAVWARRLRHPRTFGALQLLSDVTVVTALVYVSGSGISGFGFLYLPIPVFGALLFDRVGAYGSALLASAAYGGSLAFSDFELGEGAAFALWSAQCGALLLVALLSSTLARELRLTGEHLDRSRARFSVLRSLHERTVESLSSGLLTTDAELRITFCNPEAERISGRSAASVLGRPLEEVLPGASGLARDVRASPSRARIELRGPRGEARHLGLAVSILRDEDRREAGYVVIFQDVTAVVKMEQELRRSSRLAGVGELAASIAHEIRNPLAAISGSVELMRGGGGEDHSRLMDIVLREIERLDALIRDFLQYARPATPKPTAVPVAALLAEVAQMLENSLPAGARLLPGGDPEALALADPTQLRQVLWNLVKNALEALDGPGEVRLGVERGPALPQDGLRDGRKRGAGGAGDVEIVVADTGRGIALADLERIFDPFYTTKADGTGLGLPTVHRILESHGGSLHVQSEPGTGTTMRVRLPAAEAPR